MTPPMTPPAIAPAGVLECDDTPESGSVVLDDVGESVTTEPDTVVVTGGGAWVLGGAVVFNELSGLELAALLEVL